MGDVTCRLETIAEILARLQYLEDRFTAAISEKDGLAHRLHYLEERVRYLEGGHAHEMATMETTQGYDNISALHQFTSPWMVSANLGSGLLESLAEPTLPPLERGLSTTSMPTNRDPTDNIVISTNVHDSPVVTWKVDNIKSKLKMSAGKPLVSPQFALGNLELKLMLFPFVGDALGERSGKELRTRERQQRFEHLVNNGPMGAALRLKANNSQKENLRYKLFVGHQDLGSFSTDFSDHIIHGTDDDGVKDLLSSFEEEDDKFVVVCRLEVLPDRYHLLSGNGPPPGLLHVAPDLLF
eukprot:GEMP01062842.1.p1 GENE.GEMP01062842.1~~GEMP01062842.1.p1  ORF type:complete len:297 (+),score=50.14 GEMP01062842.1:74-964(+)